MPTVEKFDIRVRVKDEASQKIKGITGHLGKLTLSMAGVYAAGRVIGKVVTTFAEFEKTMATVGGVARANAEELKKMTAVAEKMGLTTEFSATQAAEGLRFLAMAGLSAQQAIIALPNALDLATAGNLSLGAAADISTNALTAMGLSVNQLNMVNDVLIGTTTRSNTTVEEMAQAFKFAAPIASAFGVSIQEVSGMLGTLANSGLKGSIAGRNLAMAMVKARQIAKKYGIESTGLVEILEELNQKHITGDLLIEEFGQESAKVALLLQKNAEAAQTLTDTLGGVEGEASKLATTMRDNVSGAIDAVTSAWNGLMIKIGGAQKGPIKDSLQDFASILRFLSSIGEAQSEATKRTIAYNEALEHHELLMRIFEAGPIEAYFLALATGVDTSNMVEQLSASSTALYDFEQAARDAIKFADVNFVLLSSMNDALEPEKVESVTGELREMTAVMKELKNLTDTSATSWISDMDEIAAKLRDGFSPTSGFTFIEDYEKSVDDFAESWKDLNDIMLNGMMATANGLVDTLKDVKFQFADILAAMARDFLNLFLRQILAGFAAKAALAVFGGPLSFLGLGQGAPSVAAAGGLGGGLSLDLPSFGSPKIAPSGVTIVFNGDIIGDEEVVRKKIIPQIERASVMNASRIALRAN